MPTYVTFPQEEEFAYPEERNVADKILNAAVLMIESSGFTVAKSDYTHGQPATTLLNVINTEDYDLAVLGSAR
ncbi:MAG: hypothetical protein MZV64_27480 [Ignavibacteriales bacterium]|nr:hypothetical protein [Ignavibacteriales bacterium]